MPELATEDSRASAQPKTIWDKTPPGRFFARILSFELVIVSALLAIPILMTPAFRNLRGVIQDPDIWWHLADARHLFAAGFIRIEPYAFTLTGKPWVNPEWLAEVPYWLGFSSFGAHGLLITAILAVELNVLAMYLLARQRTGNAWTSFAAALPGFLLLTVNAGPRTILWGYLCLAIELAILEAWKRGHRRILWLVPPLFTLWINLHGSWAIGALIFLVFAALSHISFSLGDFYSERRPIRELRRIWIVTALSVGAVFINPYGWRLVWNPVDMALHQKLNIANVMEWQPLHIQSLRGGVVVLILVVLLITNGMRRRRWNVFEAFLVIFGAYAAMDHVRFCVLFAILAAPSLACDLHRTWMEGENSKQKRPLLNGIVALAFWAFAIAHIPSPARVQKAYDSAFPTRLIAQIQPDWRIFNTSDLGGYLAFHHKPEFIDSRFGAFEHHGVLKDYLQTIYIRNTVAILDQYRIDHVIYKQDSSFVYFLLHTGGWKQVGEQDGYALLARSSPQIAR